jgi:hypothetical protein
MRLMRKISQQAEETTEADKAMRPKPKMLMMPMGQ